MIAKNRGGKNKRSCTVALRIVLKNTSGANPSERWRGYHDRRQPPILDCRSQRSGLQWRSTVDDIAGRAGQVGGIAERTASLRIDGGFNA
jgi:hypothetical protein